MLTQVLIFYKFQFTTQTFPGVLTMDNNTKKNTVSRGIILAAGYGTRFLPVTKTIPKEMLPIIDVPSIEYIVNEFIQSEITKILMITSRRKKPLEDYFDREVELENFLDLNNKKDLQKKLSCFNADFYFIRQKHMLGTGDALLMAEDFTNGEPFVVAYPDDVVISDIPLTRRLISEFKETHKSVIAVEEVAAKYGRRYGVVNIQNIDGHLSVKCIEEKPDMVHSDKVMISIGRYLYTPEVFNVLKSQKEQQLSEGNSQTNMLNYFSSVNRLSGVKIDGLRYDLGQPDGYVKAITHAALQNVDMRENYLEFLRSLPDLN